MQYLIDSVGRTDYMYGKVKLDSSRILFISVNNKWTAI